MAPNLIIDEIDKFTTKDILSFLKAFTRAPKIPKDLFNKLLNKFVRDIELNMVQKDDLIEFIETYALIVDEMKEQQLDTKLLLSFISKHIHKMYSSKIYKFSLSELTKIYWVYGALDVFSDESSSELVKPLEIILNDLLSVLIAKYKPLSTDGERKDLGINNKDINVIKHYYQKYGNNGWLTNSDQIVRLIDTIVMKYDEKSEQKKKWFAI